jgi:hypothetical protein
MAIWQPAPVAEEPKLTLVSWRVLKTEIGERHFAGIRLDTQRGRVSSPIIEFTPETLVGTTRTGRVYRLLGTPRWAGDALYTWLLWCELYQVAEWYDVTDEVLAATWPMATSNSFHDGLH